MRKTTAEHDTRSGSAIFSMIILSLTTLVLHKGLFKTPSINSTQYNNTVSSAIMLGVVAPANLLNVVLTSDVMLSVVAPVNLLNVTLTNAVVLNVVALQNAPAQPANL